MILVTMSATGASGSQSIIPLPIGDSRSPRQMVGTLSFCALTGFGRWVMTASSVTSCRGAFFARFFWSSLWQ